MRGLVLLALLLAASGPAAAQGTESYPSKPVRMVVGAAPGGNPDVLARLLGQKLSDAFGKPFIIENMPGAGGVPAAVSVAKAPAGLPRDIVARLQAAVVKALRERDVSERMANLGMELTENGTGHYVQFVRDDLERYAAAVKAAGVKVA